MKKLIIILLVASSVSFAQFKKDYDKPIDIKSGITNYNPSGFFTGFFNPQNFDMHHTVSMSYSSFGGQGVALGVYTNSMAYKFSENLDVEADVSFVNSPYSSLGDAHTKSLNGIYLSRAQLNYRFSDDFHVTLRYNQVPGGYYSPYGYGYNRYSPFGFGDNHWRD